MDRRDSANSSSDIQSSAGSQILAALKGTVDPVGVSLIYRLATVWVALATLALPIIYLSLIGLVALGVYWHATRDTGIAKVTQSVYAVILFYIGPIVAGVVAILFMIKPIFARLREETSPLALDRDKEPLIYAYVDQLCALLKAPKPKRIYVDCQVNAGAGYSAGIGWFLGGVELYLGLPLAGAMDLRGFTGVLAHELGHFSQGKAGRLTFIIRKTNNWFARAVYQRDKWDWRLNRLARQKGVGALRLVFLFSILIVWGVRKILWSLMLAGHMIGAFMLRQMEFNADQYAARVSGGDSFEQTHRRLVAASAAFQSAMAELDHAWRERRLVDDFPQLVRNREAAISPRIVQLAQMKLDAASTKLFATHPGTEARVAAARRGNYPGIVTIDAPATALFADYKELCRLVTIQFYQKFLGTRLRAEHLYPTEEIVQRHEIQREQLSARRRLFQDLLDPSRPIFPGSAGTTSESADDRAALILEARALLHDRLDVCRAAAQAYSRARGNFHRAVAASALRSAGVEFKPANLQLSTNDDGELQALLKQSTLQMEQARTTLDPVIRRQVQRLQAAVSLLQPESPKTAVQRSPDDVIDFAQPAGGEQSPLFVALIALAEAAAPIQVLRRRYVELGVLMGSVRPSGNRPALISDVRLASRRAVDSLREAHAHLMRAPYPFEHALGNITVSQFCCSVLPAANQFNRILPAVRSTLQGFDTLYLRLFSRLSESAEIAENAIGLQPLSDPAGPTVPEEDLVTPISQETAAPASSPQTRSN